VSGFDRLFDPGRDAAIVTGAGNGIGRAIALGLVEQNVRTVFADINAQTLDAAVKTAADLRIRADAFGCTENGDFRFAAAYHQFDLHSRCFTRA